MRFMSSYGIALLVIVLIAGWLASGTLIIGGRGAGQGERPMVDVIGGEDGPLRPTLEWMGLTTSADEEVASIGQQRANERDQLSVRVARYSAEILPIEVPLRGRTMANASIAVRAETNGLVQDVHVRKGDTVAAGDLICTLDQGTRQMGVAQAEAGLVQAEAALAQAEADLDANAQLRERGVVPANTARALELAVRSAEAQLVAARLAFGNALAELARTEIRTHAAGVVQDPMANIGDNLDAGGQCATIVQLDPMVFIGRVAEGRMGQVRVGMLASIRLITAQTVEGEVRFIAASADPSTRTFAIEIAIANPDQTLLDGVTAEAVIVVDALPAHLLPQSVLILATDGTLGVQTLQGDRAVFRPVQILRDTAEGIWVAGLPETVDVITVGQDYVADGQQIIAVSTNGDDESRR